MQFSDCIDQCKKCKSSIDFDQELCLDCRRGFFYPEQVIVILSNSNLRLETSTKQSQLIIASIMTVFMIEHHLDLTFTQILDIDEKRKRSFLIKKLRSEFLNSDVRSSHLLLVGIKKLSKHQMNTLTLKWLAKGYKKVSFLFFI